MNLFNRKAVHSALVRSGVLPDLLLALVVLTGCGGRGQSDASSPDSSPGSSPGSSLGSSLGSAGTGTLGTGGFISGGASAMSGGAGTGGMMSLAIITRTSTGGGTGQAGSASGGDMVQGGSAASSAVAQAGNAGAGQAVTCASLGWLQQAVEVAAQRMPATCLLSTDPSHSATMGKPSGTISIDGEGRVAFVTGPAQYILVTLADDRWPCVAGATFFYWCPAYF